MNTKRWLGGCLFCGLLCGGLVSAAGAVPAESHPTSRPSALRAQIQHVNTQLAAARARHMSLQSQVTDLENQNAERKRKLQQRDAEIEALRRKLAAAGVAAPTSAPGPATSAGH